PPRVERSGRRVVLAVECHLPGVRPQCPTEDFHQRRFAGAVLADERVDFGRPQLQIDAAQGHRGVEPLADALHPQPRRRPGHGRRASFGVWIERFAWTSLSKSPFTSSVSTLSRVTIVSPVERTLSPPGATSNPSRCCTTVQTPK